MSRVILIPHPSPLSPPPLLSPPPAARISEQSISSPTELADLFLDNVKAVSKLKAQLPLVWDRRTIRVRTEEM